MLAPANAGAVDGELSVLYGLQSLTEWPRFGLICVNRAEEKCNALDLFVLVTLVDCIVLETASSMEVRHGSGGELWR